MSAFPSTPRLVVPLRRTAAGLRIARGAFLVGLAWWLGAPIPTTRAAEGIALASPNGRLVLSIRLPAPGSPDLPRWSATFGGKPILADCALALATADAGELMAGVRVVGETRRTVRDRIPVPFGKADHAEDHHHELRLALETPRNRRSDLVFRVYDDAIALRYELPAHGTDATVTITNEGTSFRLAGEPTAYVQYLEHFRTSHEHAVTTTPYAKIRQAPCRTCR